MAKNYKDLLFGFEFQAFWITQYLIANYINDNNYGNQNMIKMTQCFFKFIKIHLCTAPIDLYHL